MGTHLAVMAGGAAGSLARYLVSRAVEGRLGGLPAGTLIVNVTGCLLIGWIMAVLAGRDPGGPPWRPMLITGFLGGYTTFSAFGYETVQLWRRDGIGWALGNIALNVVLGCAAVALGTALAERRGS